MENRLDAMSFVLCALPCDRAPEPHVDTGVITKRKNDMERCYCGSNTARRSKTVVYIASIPQS